ncbi:hypothetical protein H0I76_10315 [Limibaculum sp. M0105]|uniref:Anti-sigma factor n=1 Tax=Thermohalobaculum xanthum TaxID=2753746 RepID=A0A8J7SCQ9_9RHOB|nr:hypothetical protein [Thermohalobaculum xanthum]MBK0399587.1 hypothetical protein [Thermohalobaculum xanthum]
MTQIRDDEWEALNAYADGECSAEVRATVARRLATDPGHAAALSRIQQVKAGLSLIAPAPVRGAADATAGRHKPFRAVAVAAAIGAVAILALTVGPRAYREAVSSPDRTAEIHEAFSANAYALDDGAPARTISTAGLGDIRAFDLSDSRLVLVDVRTFSASADEMVAMHYRGFNGCRLTVTAARAGGDRGGDRAADTLFAHWTARGIDFRVVAAGMDADRFAAITALLRSESLRDDAADGLRIAVRSATDSAVPCA